MVGRNRNLAHANRVGTGSQEPPRSSGPSPRQRFSLSFSRVAGCRARPGFPLARGAPMTQRRFLTADWNNILMLNYAVDASLLERFVPAGTQLDLFEGRTWLSLVGFEFNRTR